MVTASVVLLYVSYSIPILCLLLRGRNTLLPPHKRGPFWTGSFGRVCNYVLLAWTLFTLVMYSFPSLLPVGAANINYVCVVYGILVLIMGLDWGTRGRQQYRRRSERGQELKGTSSEETGDQAPTQGREKGVVQGREVEIGSEGKRSLEGVFTELE